MPAVDHGTPPLYASATQGALQEIPLYLELAYLLVQPGNETGIIFLFVVLVTAEDAGGALSQRIILFAYLAGVNLKPAGQFGYCLFTFCLCYFREQNPLLTTCPNFGGHLTVLGIKQPFDL